MRWPRDDNLRLIGAEEEARHIGTRLRGAGRATAACLFAGLVCFGAACVLASESELFGLSAEHQAAVLAWIALACSLCCFFSLFYGARMARYWLYRWRHRAFLRKYNRL